MPEGEDASANERATERDDAAALPRDSVRETYDRIATHFASTREYAWPEVDAFVEEWQAQAEPTAVGLDLGCGNCRHAELLAPDCATVIGLDVSRGLLETARERSAEREFPVALCQGDAASLPLASNTVDVAVYVATLHHLPTRAARRASLDDLARVLAPDGRALVSAWSTAHDRFDAEDGFDTTVEWTLPGGEPVDRFYHIYAPEEFEADLEASDLEILEWEVSSGNCYATVSGAQSPPK
ncbi:class I SAM-dependent methyltransferase [Natronolimnobius baerhuensis]|uniref:SAM-dependent methyltransferase n=1 Tax=Natronolimnobius baerhuensis TaxID=253108 RepID=A0A202E979_9EURY|nr:class I SAM-dependent methyltransferase [Natronolimnobius baerhuensis]OVE84777.1 SAM-dependent methyltransferase [Natronolimnobius baerhuensis]